jgi:hypothetical protein
VGGYPRGALVRPAAKQCHSHRSRPPRTGRTQRPRTLRPDQARRGGRRVVLKRGADGPLGGWRARSRRLAKRRQPDTGAQHSRAQRSTAQHSTAQHRRLPHVHDLRQVVALALAPPPRPVSSVSPPRHTRTRQDPSGPVRTRQDPSGPVRTRQDPSGPVIPPPGFRPPILETSRVRKVSIV